MRKYVKPVMQVERFVLNEAVANGAGCYHVDATQPAEVKVNCIIGGQSETVFTSCSTKATQYKLVKNYKGDTDYFVWYTYAGDVSGKQNANTKFLADLVVAAGFTSGSGWHYAKVDATGTAAFDTYTIS